MHSKRRSIDLASGMRVIVAAMVMMFTAGASSVGWAQAATDPSTTYPNRPIKLIVHVAPGAGSDIAARFLAEKMTEAFGQPVIVDNRPAAGGRVAAEMGAKAAPDGYTLTMSPTGSMAIAPALYAKLNYDVLQDFAPITNVVEIPLVLIANPAIPMKTLAEVIAAAQSRPGTLDYASVGGAGTITHLAMELLQSASKTKFTHIPYKGGSDAHSDLISGRIPLMVDSLASAMPQIRAGKVRGIAVFSLERQKIAPEIPTIAESGYPGFEAVGWIGVAAPAKTPAPILDKLNREIVRIVNLPDTRDRFNSLGFSIRSSTRAQYADFFRTEISKWSTVVKTAGVIATD